MLVAHLLLLLCGFRMKIASPPPIPLHYAENPEICWEGYTAKYSLMIIEGPLLQFSEDTTKKSGRRATDGRV